MTLTIPIHITAFYAGLMTLWYVALAGMVIRQRFKQRVGLGDGGQPQLQAARRIHGNAAEYLPLALLLILVLELLAAPVWLLHGLGLAVLAGRVLHAAGLSRTTGASWPRTAAMMLTLTALVVGAAACLVYALAV